MNLQSVCIRVDGDHSIGIGHVIRCLSLSQAFRKKGIRVHWISASLSPVLKELLSPEGIALEIFQATPGSPRDAELTLSRLQAIKPDWLIIDGYAFTETYQRKVLGKDFYLLVIDDFGHCDEYAADILLNQNIYAPGMRYKTISKQIKMLLGSPFVLLRRQFSDRSRQPKVISELGTKILVTFGGSDAKNLTALTLDALDQLDDERLSIKAILGAANVHTGAVKKIAETSRHEVECILNSNHMPELMEWADFAVTGAGSTCWELAYMGVPSITMAWSENLRWAENQIAIGKGLQGAGIYPYAGWFADVNRETFANDVKCIIADRERRQEMSEKARALIDGQGKWRVLEAMQEDRVRN